MDGMNISSVTKKYSATSPDLYTLTVVMADGTVLSVPLAPGNRHYDEIMKQVAAGDLTIADAD